MQDGKSALALVVESAGSWEEKRQIVRILLDAGAVDNSALGGSLIAAVRAKNADDMKWLLAVGANKDAKAEVRSRGVESAVVDRFVRLPSKEKRAWAVTTMVTRIMVAVVMHVM